MKILIRNDVTGDYLVIDISDGKATVHDTNANTPENQHGKDERYWQLIEWGVADTRDDYWSFVMDNSPVYVSVWGNPLRLKGDMNDGKE